ncbi:Retrovirus-related Pol polyprotein from transposon RE2-like protein [Drosera capensis]
MTNAFLHDTLDEEVYMSQPPEFFDSQFLTYVIRLRKALYGLKQASRAGYQEFTSALIAYGFIESVGDNSYLDFVEMKSERVSVSVHRHKTTCQLS